MPTLSAPSAEVQITPDRGLCGGITRIAESATSVTSFAPRSDHPHYLHNVEGRSHEALAYSTKALNVPIRRISSIVLAREFKSCSVHTKYARQRARETATLSRFLEKRNSGPRGMSSPEEVVNKKNTNGDPRPWSSRP